MSAMFILVGVSLLVAVGFLIAFVWSVNNGQYDDEYTPSIRMLFDNTLTQQKDSKIAPPYQEEIARIKNKPVSKKQK